MKTGNFEERGIRQLRFPQHVDGKVQFDQDADVGTKVEGLKEKTVKLS